MPQKTANFSNSPAHLLRRCQQYAAELYAEEVGRSGVTPRQLTVLQAVEKNDGASQTDLVRITGIDRSTLADMIQRLLARDLLARKRMEEDARANAVRLTPKGLRAIKGVTGAAAKAEARLLETLPAGKRNEFVKAMTIIATAAEAAEPNGDGRKARK